MKHLLFLLLLTSCASYQIIRGGPEKTACGAALDLRIEGYFAGCDAVEVLEIIRKDREAYVSKGKCIKHK